MPTSLRFGALVIRNSVVPQSADVRSADGTRLERIFTGDTWATDIGCESSFSARDGTFPSGPRG